MSFAQRLDTHRLRSLWNQFFGTIALMEFVLKHPCQQLCSFSPAPCQRSYASPMGQGLEILAGLGRTVFRNNRIDEMKFVLKNPCQQQWIFSVAPWQRSYACPIAQCFCTPLDKSWAHSFSGQSHWGNLSWKTRANSLANKAIAQCLHTAWQVLGTQFFGTFTVM